MSTTTFMLVWDMHGLESCINITEIEHKKVLNTLSGAKDETSVPLNLMLLRARVNSQRHYEIYAVTVDESITENDLVTMFKDSPQTSADLIRERGHKIYCNRRRQNDIAII